MLNNLSYNLLKQNNIIIEGDFTLKSGLQSNYYIDIKKTISKPLLFNKIINKLCNYIKYIPNLESYCIIGVPYAGISFASAVAYKLLIPQLLLRKEQKQYGRKKRIDGESENKNIILIEDVMTTGQSLLETINYLSKEGYNIDYIFTIFQRKEINYNKFLIKNINYTYLISRDKLLRDKLLELCPLHNIYTRLYNISLLKQSNIILSVDTNNIKQFSNIVIECGKYIVAIKVHLDIFNDKDKKYIRNFLRIQKEKLNFLVIEDRKFSDICKTNIQQMEALEVINYADIIICHGVSGFEFTKQENCKLPVLLVSQLSNKNNLINKEYTEKCIKEVINNSNIIGCISQENLGYNKTLYCKPGIRLDNKSGDNLDQQYTGYTKGIDYYIVGRGITTSKTISETANFYKTQLYK